MLKIFIALCVVIVVVSVALLLSKCMRTHVDPGPVDPGPVDPGPVDPGPVDPGPFTQMESCLTGAWQDSAADAKGCLVKDWAETLPRNCAVTPMLLKSDRTTCGIGSSCNWYCPTNDVCGTTSHFSPDMNSRLCRQLLIPIGPITDPALTWNQDTGCLTAQWPSTYPNNFKNAPVFLDSNTKLPCKAGQEAACKWYAPMTDFCGPETAKLFTRGHNSAIQTN
jgi:hypothetical protein